MASRRAVKIIAIVLSLIIVATVVCLALTYPQDVANEQFSFTLGYSSQTKQFQMPVLHDKAQIQVTVTSGYLLWSISIVDANGSEAFSYSASQSGQTTYTSQWINLQSGAYNVTFNVAGLGNLQATMKVTTKGGVW